MIVSTISIEVIAMIKEATAMTVRQNLGELLNGIQYGHDQIIITKGGKPVAAMVDSALFERIRRMQSRFDQLCRRIESAYAVVPEDEGLAEIDAAVAAVRAKQ
jgi:prevent-host-death family protein